MAKHKYDAEIKHLEAIVNGGVQSVATDGLSTTFSINDAKKRLAELKRLRGDSDAKRKVTPVDLGGCW